MERAVPETHSEPDEMQLPRLAVMGRAIQFVRDLKQLMHDIRPMDPDSLPKNGNWGGL